MSPEPIAHPSANDQRTAAGVSHSDGDLPR
jgi:hypothetical protein